ncbi:hypothetical protein DRJ25_05350 [Candidatus Woesearchaeota archaeon]|nr:MAG: hypothetical protein DRJ25_05350 [Candidatus Woesearchaeota archaeon]
MVVRWLGAFRKNRENRGLYSALCFEIESDHRKHVAAERLQRGRSFIKHAKVGLLIKNSAVVKKYAKDVFSEYNKNGTLKRTRHQDDAWSDHSEVFCRPEYLGVVLKSTKISQTALQAVQKFAEKYDAPVFYLNPGTRRLDRIQIV